MDKKDNIIYISEEEMQNNELQKIINESHGTHKKFLQFYVEITNGDILEFGTGHNSTGLIRSLIEGSDRKLISYENNYDWYTLMKKTYPENKNHQYIYIDETKTNWESVISVLPKLNFSVVFIDQSPWDARRITMEHFRDTSEYVLIHDVDYFPNNGIFGSVKQIEGQIEGQFDFSDISDNWKLYYPEKPWPAPTGPPTLVFSNTGKMLYDFKQKEKCGMVGCGVIGCSCNS
jgi:hypothetical protein